MDPTDDTTAHAERDRDVQSADDPYERAERAIHDERLDRLAENHPADEAVAADEPAAVDQPAAADEPADHATGHDSAENRVSPEEFAAAHDPADHDVEAGRDFRQPGDWTAEDGDGPQVMEGQSPAASANVGGAGSSDPTAGRRSSSLEEVRDGGYGVGSAAPIDDGAVPFGHPVKAWQDTMTCVAPEHPSYDDADPHVWFTDTGAAERAGFRHID